MEWLSVVLKSFFSQPFRQNNSSLSSSSSSSSSLIYDGDDEFFCGMVFNKRRWVYLQLTTWPKLSTFSKLWHAASSDNHYTVLRKTGLFGCDFVLISLMNWGTFAVRSICINFFSSKPIRLWVFINVFRKKIISNFASFKALQFLTSLSTVSEFEVFVTLISSHWRGE